MASAPAPTALAPTSRRHVQPQSQSLRFKHEIVRERHHPYQRSTTTPTLPGMATLLRRSQRASTRRLQATNEPHSTPEHTTTWSSGLPRSLGTRPSSWTATTSSGFPLPPTSTLTPLAVALTAGRRNEDVGTSSSSSSSSASVSSTDNSPAKTSSTPPPANSDAVPRKTSRYLREMDRRRILVRIAQGEKQAALAKEYRVSRAAICNLNKHRAQVLSRNHEHPLAKHPKRRSKPQSAKTPVQPPKAPAQPPSKLPRLQPLIKSQLSTKSVGTAARSLRPASSKARVVVTVAKPKLPVSTTNIYEVRTRSVVRFHSLLTRPVVANDLQPPSLAEIRGLADRLMTLVLEEALAWATPGSLGSATSSALQISPVSAQSEPMLRRVRSLDPSLSASIGAVPSAKHCAVLLVDVATTLEDALKAATAVLDRGESETAVCLVTLSVASSTLGELLRRFPSMKVVAAHIERGASDVSTTSPSLLAERVEAAYTRVEPAV